MAEHASDHGYRGPQVCAIIGITYRQLDYWARTNLIRPSIADAKGSGTQRLYSYRDLVELKVIKNLLDAGVSLQSARKAITYLREHMGEDVASANLVISGAGSVIACTGQELVDILQQGQGVLNIVLGLGGVVSELDAAIHELAPAVNGDGAPTTAEAQTTEARSGPRLAAGGGG